MMLGICHTYYSLRAGVRSPEDWARAAAERGYTALAVADVNNLHGAVHFYRAVRATGLQPVIGATLEWGAENECLVLAPSAAGYRQLCRLLTGRHLWRDFTIASALSQGISELIFLARAPGLLQQLARIVPAGQLYALPRHTVARCARAALWDMVPVSVPTAAVPEAWFIDKGDAETFSYLNELRRVSGARALCPEPVPGMVLPEAAAWRQCYPDNGAAAGIMARCTFTFRFGVPLFPSLALPAGRTAAEHLGDLCARMLRRKYTGKAGKFAVRARLRLRRELAVIARNHFADYFLYVYEIIRFAQARGIPVEVRGSAASSVVSYLLGFTHCCPLEHDLFFERFLNPGRCDCPDIDVDIADTRRDEVIAYCYRRWGAERVAMIATILTYRARSAVRDAGRILGLPSASVQQFLDTGRPVPQQSRLVRIAGRLSGLPRHVGIHCGGLVITPCPLTDVTPLRRAAKGVVITHYEKDQAEAIGLVKMDLLGNSSLSVIRECCFWLDRRGETLAEPGPAYDYKVDRLFGNGDTLGVYQCESPGMRQLCRALKPRTPKEVSAALSLIRPGPAAAGMKEAYIRRRRRLDPVTHLHPKMATFLDSTYGIMLYQEDVMKVAANLTGYSMADADTLRRLVSKRPAAAVLERERQHFVFTKAASSGIDARTAAKIWEQVSRFASYAYCKAHASVYGRLAWLTARLKTRYPREFYAAVLNCHTSMYPPRVFVWDALRHGIPVLPVDINRSEVRWAPVRSGVLAGLGIVKGMRRRVLEAIVSERRRAPFANLSDLRRRVSFQAGELERLILLDACRAFGRRERLLAELRSSGSDTRQLPLFTGEPAAVPNLDESELALTGIPFTRHPADAVACGSCRAADLGGYVNREVVLVGILDAYKHTEAKDAGGAPRQMSFVTLEDGSGVFDLVLFPEQHARFGHLFTVLGPYRVRGIVRRHWDSFPLELVTAARV